MGRYVDVVHLDFAKDFDKVVHGILLHKLKTLGITGKVGLWLLTFLTPGTQAVKISGKASNSTPVVSGVPQGSVLGPLLFLVLMAEITDGLQHAILTSFADDSNIHSHIFRP